MGKITGVGTPTRKTAGAIGDIYIDSKTGHEYICTFAYKTGSDEAFDCEWKKRVDSKNVKNSSMSEKNEKEEKSDTNTNTTEMAKECSETESSVTPKRRDYSAYSKKNR